MNSMIKQMNGNRNLNKNKSNINILSGILIIAVDFNVIKIFSIDDETNSKLI